MPFSDRITIIVLFLSVFIGFAFGSWASTVWPGSLTSLAATFAGVVVAYYAIAFVARKAGYPVE